MREYILALTRRIGYPSLSERTLFLFERAMERGHFRYGRKARLVAGASLACLEGSIGSRHPASIVYASLVLDSTT